MSFKYGPGFPWSAEAVADLRKFKADGLSCSEIAKRLSLPLGTVKSRMRLAYAKLKQKLEEIR